jgi:hypothetical protein
VELYEKVTGKDFRGDDHPDPHARVSEAVETWLRENANGHG